MFILDSLHESLSKRVVMNITKCSLLTDRQKSHQKSLEVWKSSFEKQYSPFVDLFFGLFHIQIICSNCNNISHNFETFNTIKGVLPEGNTSPTLVECLEAELNDETISDYECEKCKPERTAAVRRTRVWKLPKNLIIVLKRFTYDGRKIHTPIQSISNTVELDSLYSDLSPNKKDSTFNLNSIVDHHGSATGGHYTAQSLHRSEHKWFVYDDQNVFPTGSPRIGESTYIIFLEKA
jgi:ubiquitin C-terminal hydrolase